MGTTIGLILFYVVLVIYKKYKKNKIRKKNLKENDYTITNFV